MAARATEAEASRLGKSVVSVGSVRKTFIAGCLIGSPMVYRYSYLGEGCVKTYLSISVDAQSAHWCGGRPRVPGGGRAVGDCGRDCPRNQWHTGLTERHPGN